MKSPKDPVDHARTTRPHAGESMKDTRNMPGLILAGVALVLFVSAIAAHAVSNHGVGIGLGSTSAVVFVVAGGWLLAEHMRVRKLEERWYAEHPDVRQQRSS
ncbi:UsfY protein [Mycolicibacterium phlei]|jgi:hypothetical protein|nr:protein UsfY [Mycolicibacterium phlei]VEG08518.1 UsfY protein [Mycobacteroides chelonae]AMO60398.1 hypothetical protein MPHLCCUG_01574 [Mycolicibacterium phlei]EID17718.1 hypothetical protein MPHLEI_02603 [Mycolicibacterium phlei RIVM601174]KXW78269.1 UsfY protein [Mycolicibacterium phlei DSM 43071]STZ16966.1 UsfY protein [Mycolicibacterium phlei]